MNCIFKYQCRMKIGFGNQDVRIIEILKVKTISKTQAELPKNVVRSLNYRSPIELIFFLQVCSMRQVLHSQRLRSHFCAQDDGRFFGYSHLQGDKGKMHPGRL